LLKSEGKGFRLRASGFRREGTGSQESGDGSQESGDRRQERLLGCDFEKLHPDRIGVIFWRFFDMRIRYFIKLLFVVITGLLGVVVCADQPRLPYLAIPFVSIAPVIDGHMNDSEWAGASGMSGLLRYGNDRLSSNKTDIRVCYDSSAMYIVWRRYQTRIAKSEATARDGALWADDAVEIFIQPHQGVGPYYQFIGNAAGVYWDSEGPDGKWNGEWTYAASVTTSYWEAELRVPWSNFGGGVPAAGTVLGFNFCTDVQDQPPSSDTWAPLGAASFHDASKYGSLVIGGSCPVVRLGTPAESGSANIGAVIDFANQSAQSKTLRSVVDITKAGKPFDSSDQTYDLAPGVTKNINEMKPREHGDYDVKVLVSDKSKSVEQPLAGRSMFISITKPPTVTIDKAHHMLVADLDVRGMGELEGAKLYAVLSNASREIAGQTYTLTAKSESARITLDLTRIKPGPHTIDIIIYSGPKRLLEHKQAVEL